MQLGSTPFILFSRIALLIICFMYSHYALANTLTASVDRNNIKSDETFTLTLSYSASTNQAPDISDINSDFDVLSNRQSSATRYVNGSISSSTTWTYSLRPKSVGKLMIPSFNFDGNVSDAIVINVEEPNYQQSNAGEEIFFETSIDKQSVYVQEQLVLTYKLFHRVNFDVVSHTLDQLDMPNTLYEPLENTSYQTQIQNETYRVQEIRYAFFAQASGSLEIPSIKWVFRTRVNNSGRYGIKRIQTDALQIKVKPIPSQYPVGATWLPSSDIKLVEQWSQDFGQLKIGEPTTRTLQLQASDLMASQLPEITPKSQNSSYSVYPEAPATDQKILSSGISALRQENSAIVINNAGTITLDDIAIPWWNTKTDSLEYARIASKTVQIEQTGTPAKTQSNSTQALQPNNNNQTGPNVNNTAVIEYKTHFIWPIISGVLCILSVVFFMLWWRLKQVLTHNNKAQIQKTQQQQKAIHDFKHVIHACHSHDASQTKHALCLWGEQHLNGAKSLAAIGAKIQDANVFDALKELDAYLYQPHHAEQTDTQWRGDDLAQALENWHSTQNNSQTMAQLKPLYPQP